MSRMAGDALSDVKFDKGFSAEHLATLDQDKVKEAIGTGGSWGWTDQARYDKLAGKKSGPEGVKYNFGSDEYKARAANMEYGAGFDKDHVAGLDQELVELAWGGKAWGEEDQARYEKMAMDGPIEDTAVSTPDEKPFEEKPAPSVTQSAGSTGNVTMNAGSSVVPKLELPGSSGLFGGGIGQQVVQDNDILSNVTGDNNTVTNTQDNSIRQNMGSSDYSSRFARGLKDKYVLNLINR